MARKRISRSDVLAVYNSGLSMNKTADRLGISHRSAARIIIEEAGVGRSMRDSSRMRFPKIDTKWLEVRRLYLAGFSTTLIAAHVGYNPANVRKIVMAFGLKRSGKVQIVRQPNRTINADGYYVIRRGHRKWLAHRLIAELYIVGRKLAPGEVVHHKNGIKTDNRPENLEVLTIASHRVAHALNATCLYCPKPAIKRFLCGSHYTRERLKGKLESYPPMRQPKSH